MEKALKLFKSLFKNKKGSDSVLSFFIFFLLLTSLLFTSSASINTGTTVASTLKNIIKQVVILSGACVLYNFFSNIFDIKRCKRYINVWLTLELLLLLAAYIWCKIHGSINGNYSWITIGLGPFQFGIQPSEFAKVMIILAVACLIGDKRFKNINSKWQMVRIPAIFLALYCFVIFILQKDAGSFLIVAIVGVSCFLFTNNPKLKGCRRLILFLGFAAIGFYFYCLFDENGRKILAKFSVTFAARFAAVTNPDYNNDATREIFYSLLGISNGNLLGVGLGNSVQKFGYLVSSDADYIFAVIVEECGLIGIAAVFVPYIFIIYRLIYYSRQMEKESDKIILLGTVVYLAIHFLFNIGGVSGFLPLTGVPLLLVSRGGSATFSIMSLLGICQNRISNYYAEKKAKSVFIN
ncbi:MAG: FtsW/RodA/SpoVE family cell cycle protein [Erysipelotrichia bacterium]|nr:FtsW/RodA/SpoVE family cell cycle protein [Erysipelotrichia bacterium]